MAVLLRLPVRQAMDLDRLFVEILARYDPEVVGCNRKPTLSGNARRLGKCASRRQQSCTLRTGEMIRSPCRLLAQTSVRRDIVLDQ